MPFLSELKQRSQTADTQLFLLLIKVKVCHTIPTGCINQYTSISVGRKADNSLLNSYQALSGEELSCQGQPGRHLPTVQS